MKYFPLLIACLFSQFSFAQNHIELKAGPLAINNNWTHNFENNQIEANAFGSFYGIASFHSIPEGDLVLELQAQGFTLLGYLGNESYLVKIDAKLSVNQLAQLPLRGIQEFPLEFKKSEYLQTENFPSWSIKENKWVIRLLLADVKDKDKVLPLLAMYDAEVLNTNSNVEYLEIMLPKENLDALASNPWVAYVEELPSPSTPDDTEGRSLHRSNNLATDFSGGLKYDGTGVSVALGDDGVLLENIDFTGRLTQINPYPNRGDHGEMTSGILMGAGNLDPTVKGMAFGADLYYYDIDNYDHVLDVPTTKGTYGIRITSTSYSQGCNAGYTSDTKEIDAMVNDDPELMHVFSAGNSSGGNCGNAAGSPWGTITGGYKQGKNVIAVANLTYQDSLVVSSSRGPATDGRLKPDISANGGSQFSAGEDNTIQVGGGTSAAAPGVAGVFAQLYHAYRDLNSGQDPNTGLIKAALLNSAEDLGNVGPDFTYGWGRVNAIKAFEILENNQYFKDTVSQGDSILIPLTVPAGTKGMKVMLYWHDEDGLPANAFALVNDLNLQVIDPGAQINLPWLLDHNSNALSLSTPATLGIDTVNNMEQVEIIDPVSGTYGILVIGDGVAMGPQEFHVVYSFETDTVQLRYPIGGESFVPGTTEEIRWDAFADTGTFSLAYSIDSGNNWNLISSVIPGDARSYSWLVPNQFTDEAVLSISRGSKIGLPHAVFNIYDTVANFVVDSVCPNFVTLTWDSVSTANQYVVHALGAKYMDSLDMSSTHSIKLSTKNFGQDNWYSVRAIAANGSLGRRNFAIKQSKGLQNCQQEEDGEVLSILSPAGVLPNCFTLDSLEVKVLIKNTGKQAIANFPVSYLASFGSVITETFTGSIAAGAEEEFSFSTRIDLSTQPIGQYDIELWIDILNDDNYLNDTLAVNFSKVVGLSKNIPYVQDFESFSLCSTGNGCETEVCVLADGWENAESGTIDGADWRTNDSGTPSNSTGPDMDSNPGTITGKYLYTEATFCFNQEMIVSSPCFDLSQRNNVYLEFDYHMNGTNMGSLSLDVFDGAVLYEDVFKAIGNKGNLWKTETVDLSAFDGKVIQVYFRGLTGSSYLSDMAIDNININADPNGIEPLVMDDEVFRIMPNPAVNQVIIDFLVDMPGDLILYDQLGNLISQQKIGLENKQLEIDISDLPAGVYEFQFVTTNYSKTNKMIKIK